jgi:hypothetical protein
VGPELARCVHLSIIQSLFLFFKIVIIIVVVVIIAIIINITNIHSDVLVFVVQACGAAIKVA